MNYQSFLVLVSLLLCTSCAQSTPKVQEQTQEMQNPATTTGATMEPMMSSPTELTEQERGMLERRARHTIHLLAQHNFAQVADEIHPKKGLLLAPSPHIDVTEYAPQIVTKLEFRSLLTNSGTRIWGNQGYTSAPLELSGKDFWEKHMWSTGVNTTLKGKIDEVLHTDMNPMAIREIIAKTFPGAHFVEYVGTGDWSVRLIFVQEQGQWYLVGIMRDEGMM